MTRYTAVCRRSGDWWAISIPEIKGVHTQTRRLDQAADMARDAIALMLDVPPDSFEVDVRPEVPDQVMDALTARQTAADAERRAAEATHAAVQYLLANGYTVRDAGSLLALSPQRVSQIGQVATAKTARVASANAAPQRPTKSAPRAAGRRPPAA